MKNHIVSQMIIKRFASAINVFDLKSGRLDLGKKPHKVFYKDGLLPEDLDHLLSTAIESRFANLLYQKLLDPNFITLNREELFLLKRYMMMVSIRMYGPDEFAEMMKSFSKNAERFLSAAGSFSPWLLSLKRNGDLHLSNQELYELALRVCCENEDITNIAADKRATLEIVAWAMTFVDAYLAIWDAPKGMEFILSDCSMISEYEGCHQLTAGLDLSKFSYCQYHLQHPTEDLEVLMQAKAISTLQIMYENYNVFNLSSKRCLVAINPFFSQYYGLKQMTNNGDTFVAPVPDVWPAVVQDKNLFRPPVTEHKLKLGYTMQDLFFYEPRTLQPEDMVYVNSMILLMSHDIIGFNDFASISDSIDYFLWSKTSMKNNDFLLLQTKDEIIKFADDFMHDPFMKLSRLCREKLGDGQQTYAIELFRKVTENMLSDFRNNKYIYWYLLEHDDISRNHPNLSFLGDEEKRMKLFRDSYRLLWGKEYVKGDAKK